MSRQLHFDQAAEREANEIAFRFMNSSDVVGDMSRAYGADLSSVRIHTDESAARKVEGTGADAFSTGRDVFFGRGVFDRGDPASRGLLAHELAHSLQQGVGGGMGGAVEQSAPEEAAQGGLLDWFRSKFGRKKKQPEPEPELEISDPQLVPDGIQRVVATNANGDATNLEFLNRRDAALNEMVRAASPEQLRDPKLREMVLNSYNSGINARLREKQAAGKNMIEMGEIFRGGAGELNTFNTMLSSFVPKDFSKQVLAASKEGGMDNAFNFISDFIEGNEDLQQFLGGTAPSFEGIEAFDDPEARSTATVSNFMLRSVNAEIGRDIGARQRAAAAAGKGPIDISDLKTARAMQSMLNVGNSEATQRLRNVLRRRFQ